MPKVIRNNQTLKLVLISVLLCFFAISQLHAAPTAESALSINGSKARYSQIEKIDNCAAYFQGTAQMASCRDGEVPAPAATWLFFLALIAFVRLSSKKRL